MDQHITPWEKLSEALVYNGYRKVYRKHFRLPNGQEANYEIVGKGEIVCALPLTKEHEVVLAAQYRVGPEKILSELPGGGVDEGETPAEAVARELLEETGFAGKVQFVATTPADGYSSVVRHHFVVTDCIKLAEPVADTDNAHAETLLLSLDEFRQHLRGGQLTDITTGYLGLDFLHLL